VAHKRNVHRTDRVLASPVEGQAIRLGRQLLVELFRLHLDVAPWLRPARFAHTDAAAVVAVFAPAAAPMSTFRAAAPMSTFRAASALRRRRVSPRPGCSEVPSSATVADANTASGAWRATPLI